MINENEVNNLRALRVSDISPAILLQTLKSDLPDIVDICCVTFDKNGQPRLFSTGNRERLPIAALYIQELVVQHLMASTKK